MSEELCKICNQVHETAGPTELFDHTYGPAQVADDGLPILGDDGRPLYLAKLVMRAGPADIVVFLNGCPLDCTRPNLRIVRGHR